MLSQSEKLEQFFFTQSLKTFYVFTYSKDIPLKISQICTISISIPDRKIFIISIIIVIP